ncbi:hypothetical protein BH09PSE1_BH09PSE1_05560 [soil metagenome]
MDIRFLDGRSARALPAAVEIADGLVRITVGDATHDWPFKGLDVVVEGDQARLSHRSDPDARLVMPKAEWTRLGGAHGEAVARRRRGIETHLVVGLTAFAAATIAFVFFGVPALSGPLARATPPSFEVGMGRNFDAQLGAVFKTCDGRPGQEALAGLGRRIASGADTGFDVRVRAVHAPMLNAFALPGGPILVTDDLIRDAKSPDELSAVVAHEVSHIEKRHVMQAVWRSLGIGLLLDAVVGGGSGAGQQAVLLAGQATDLRYGRAAESEADVRGQQLLHKQGLSSRGMASFFARLGGEADRTKDDDFSRVTEFASTHPDSVRRARIARAAERPGAVALSPAEWAAVKASCGKNEDGPIRVIRKRFGLGRP